MKGDEIMGGKEGARGYLYQTIAAVLSSLLNDTWEYVQVEPDTHTDKVDIIWKYKDGNIKVVQVKSSQNNFQRSHIEKWLDSILCDVDTANAYELFLIGNVSDTTSRFIKKLNNLSTLDSKNKDYERLKRFIPYAAKINIMLENFSIESLESRIQVNLNKVLTNMGYSFDVFEVEQIAAGLVHQFNKFSIEGKEVYKEDYLNIITQFLRRAPKNCPKKSVKSKIDLILANPPFKEDFTVNSDRVAGSAGFLLSACSYLNSQPSI